MMEGFLAKQSEIAEKTYGIWIAMLFIMLFTFFIVMVQIQRIYELHRRRAVVAAFLG